MACFFEAFVIKLCLGLFIAKILFAHSCIALSSTLTNAFFDFYKHFEYVQQFQFAEIHFCVSIC